MAQSRSLRRSLQYDAANLNGLGMKGVVMGTRPALVGSAVGAALVALAGLAGMAHTPPSAEQVLIPDFSIDVRAGVKARGFVALSKPYNTTESSSRRIRVLAYSLKFLVNDQERLGEFGMPAVDADGREPVRSSPSGFGPPERGAAPEAGEELLPRRCQVTIRPRGELTWGAITRPDQLDVSVDWVTY
jgi:hypothetical protein